MFKNYKDLCDVVSLLVYCPSERYFLVTKEASGETWLPSMKCERNCWKSTVLKITFEESRILPSPKIYNDFGGFNGGGMGGGQCFGGAPRGFSGAPANFSGGFSMPGMQNSFLGGSNFGGGYGMPNGTHNSMQNGMQSGMLGGMQGGMPLSQTGYGGQGGFPPGQGAQSGPMSQGGQAAPVAQGGQGGLVADIKPIKLSDVFGLQCLRPAKCLYYIMSTSPNKILFGTDVGQQCVPIRVFKTWLPKHTLPCVYHAVYKVLIKPDMKKKLKMKGGIKNRLLWANITELERQRAHASLRSPELSVYVLMVTGDQIRDSPEMQADMDFGMLIEVCEEQTFVGPEVGGGAVTMASPNLQLLESAGYSKEDQFRLYREFVLMVFPCMYMSQNPFTQFMVDIGFQRPQCPALFRAADLSGRGGLTFLDLMLWCAALEPATQHSGSPAETRCRYIFRYFDSNRDSKLEYLEFKELIAAARAARQLPIDALNVARDADVCLRQLALQPNSQLQLADFLRSVGELRLRGTSSLLRAPKTICGYIMDLHERDQEMIQSLEANTSKFIGSQAAGGSRVERLESRMSASATRRAQPPPDYRMAIYTVRIRRRHPYEMIELCDFDEDAVTSSTIRLLGGLAQSLEVLGPGSLPVEALAAVHYFATSIEKPHRRPADIGQSANKELSQDKPAWSWATAEEEAALGALLLRLAQAVQPICAAEPRLLRLNSPCYVVGDLHGNLGALLSMEAAFWAGGSVVSAARLLFLGDFVDRGVHGAELMAYLLAAKLQRPASVLLIRGNHETRDIQKMFSFHNECLTKYGETEGPKIWNAINNVFDVLPLAAVVDDKVFCCHGGIPPPWVCPLISAIDKVPVPLARPAEQSSIAWELLWNDPVKPNKMTATLQLELAANEGFAANSKRGTGHVFDQTALDRFLVVNQLSHVLRAHELHQNGFMCQLRGRLITVFSSYRYCGGNNDSGVALLEGGKLRLLRVNPD